MVPLDMWARAGAACGKGVCSSVVDSICQTVWGVKGSGTISTPVEGGWAGPGGAGKSKMGRHLTAGDAWGYAGGEVPLYGIPVADGR